MDTTRLPDDFREFLQLRNSEKIEYLASFFVTDVNVEHDL